MHLPNRFARLPRSIMGLSRGHARHIQRRTFLLPFLTVSAVGKFQRTKRAACADRPSRRARSGSSPRSYTSLARRSGRWRRRTAVSAENRALLRRTFIAVSSGSSSLLIWAKGQWAPFRQLPRRRRRASARGPVSRCPAARGLAEDRPLTHGPRPGGRPMGLAGPGAVVEGDVTPLGPAGGGLAPYGQHPLAGGPVAACVCVPLAPLVGGWDTGSRGGLR